MSFYSFFFLSLASSSVLFNPIRAAIFEVQNQCPFTIWPAAVPGGGRQLNQGQAWTFNVPVGTKQARIWARTNCIFDGSDRGRCETGDCGGLLECQAFGQPPNTLAELSLNSQLNNLDFYDISLVDGFNVPMDFSPTGGCTGGIRCTADINGQCPNKLRTPGGCNNPCTVFKTNEYCCNSGSCRPTNFSRFFKERCPDAYSYPKDDATGTFTCPGGINYRVVFCPDIGPTTFEVQNQCPYTVWAAAVPGGGKQLEKGQTWTFSVEPYTILGSIWGRTNCTFDESGLGKCETGDCGGKLVCESSGAPPVTVAEYALSQFNGQDFFDVSLLDGFNVPMSFVPNRPNTTSCRGVNCSADINGGCPNELRVPGGCNDPCTVFNTDEYCCNSGMCGPTSYSRFFKDRCPDAYSYPMDNTLSPFSCPPGTNYKVVFCP